MMPSAATLTTLTLSYAAFRLVERLAGVRHQAMVAEVSATGALISASHGARLALTVLLGFARVFRWGFLVYFGLRSGWIAPILVAVIALPVAALMHRYISWMSEASFGGIVTGATIVSFVLLPAVGVWMCYVVTR